jgi:hypothetical protein
MAAMFAASEQVEAVERVWTPETGGLVDPWQVPWIVDAHARRLRRGVARNVAIVLFGLVAAPAAVWVGLRFPETRGILFTLALLTVPWVFGAAVELFRLANPRRASRDLLAAPALGKALATWTGRRFRRTSLGMVVAWPSSWPWASSPAGPPARSSARAREEGPRRTGLALGDGHDDTTASRTSGSTPCRC